MKIVIIGNYGYGGQQSMQRFSALLQRLGTEAGHEVRMVNPEPVLAKLNPTANGVGKWLGYIDRFLLFLPRLRGAAAWADVVHICDQANAMYVPLLKDKPHVLTCHDMLAIRSALGEIPGNPTSWTGRILQRWTLSGLRKAQRIVCVSEQTRSECVRVTKLSEDRIVLVHNALNYSYSPMPPAEASSRLTKLGIQTSRPFLMHVGNNNWYKNRQGVLRIFSALRNLPEQQSMMLVMVGKRWTSAMREYVSQAGLLDHVQEINEVTDEDLRAIYSMAEALMFPSLQEGFGWPVLEAQACGCPVFTSDRTPLTEVGGDGAIYFDPQRESEAAQVIVNGLSDKYGMRARGFANVARFSERAMVLGYEAAYGDVTGLRAATYQVTE